MPIRVPEYRNHATKRVIHAADGRMTPAPERNFDGGAQSMAAMGKAIGQVGQQWAQIAARQAERESAKRQADIMLAFEKENDALLNGTLDEKGNTVVPGLLASQLEGAKGTAKTYLTKGNELIDKYLGMAQTRAERDYLERALGRSYENSYNRMINHELTQTRASASASTKAYFDTAAGMAGAITDTKTMREHLDDLYQMSDKEGRANGKDDVMLKADRYTIAGNNVKSSVEGSVFNNNIAAARNVLKGAKDDLLPEDYNKLLHYVDKAEKTLQKATQEERMAPLYERALKMAEADPDTLQEEIVQLLRNPASAQAEYSKQYGPMKAKQLIEYAKWTQNNLLDSDDTRAGQIKTQNWQEHENGFNAFKWEKKGEKYKIGNKDMRNPQTVLAAIGALQGHIDHHDFNKEDMKQAQKDLARLRGALGDMDIKANDTALGEVVRQANILSGGTERRIETGEVTKVPVMIDGVMTPLTNDVKNYETHFVGGILSAEEKGLIVEQSAQFLQAANVNLLAEDPKTRQQARAAVQTVARDYVRSKFGVVRDDVTDVQVGDNTFKSYGIKPNPNLGASITSNLDGYRYEEQNGVAYLVKRDKRGNELHRQLL